MSGPVPTGRRAIPVSPSLNRQDSGQALGQSLMGHTPLMPEGQHVPKVVSDERPRAISARTRSDTSEYAGMSASNSFNAPDPYDSATAPLQPVRPRTVSTARVFASNLMLSHWYTFFYVIMCLLCLFLLIWKLLSHLCIGALECLEDDDEDLVYSVLDIVCTVVLGVEICIRILATRKVFFKSCFNIFDLVVLIACIASFLVFQLGVHPGERIGKSVLLFVRYTISLLRLILMLKRQRDRRRIVRVAEQPVDFTGYDPEDVEAGEGGVVGEIGETGAAADAAAHSDRDREGNSGGAAASSHAYVAIGNGRAGGGSTRAGEPDDDDVAGVGSLGASLATSVPRSTPRREGQLAGGAAAPSKRAIVVVPAASDPAADRFADALTSPRGVASSAVPIARAGAGGAGVRAGETSPVLGPRSQVEGRMGEPSPASVPRVGEHVPAASAAATSDSGVAPAAAAGEDGAGMVGPGSLVSGAGMSPSAGVLSGSPRVGGLGAPKGPRGAAAGRQKKQPSNLIRPRGAEDE